MESSNKRTTSGNGSRRVLKKPYAQTWFPRLYEHVRGLGGHGRRGKPGSAARVQQLFLLRCINVWVAQVRGGSQRAGIRSASGQGLLFSERNCSCLDPFLPRSWRRSRTCLRRCRTRCWPLQRPLLRCTPKGACG